MDYEESWYQLTRWLSRQALDDPINGIVFLDVLDKMDAMWNEAHNMEVKDGV